MSPFQALYDRPPPSIPNHILGSATSGDLDNSLQHQKEILQLLKENLKRTQQRMADQAHKNRTDHTFEPGSRALLNL